MLNRPTRVQRYMEHARIEARQSTCMRLNVGAVVVVRRRMIGFGYNGSPPGHPHCLGNDCPGRLVCKETIHAERNAITMADKMIQLVGEPWDLYSTDSPCPECAAIAWHHRVNRVFFATPYRITDSLDFLIEKGVEVYRVMPAGYIMDWKTRDVVEVET